LPTDNLVPLAGKLLEVRQELVRTAVDLELADGAVTADTVGDKPCATVAENYLVWGLAGDDPP
jgi:exodeoxyribonuclease V alpha subunit